MEKSSFIKLKPMLLEEVLEPFNSKEYLFELKFDGIRSLIFIDNGKIVIRSRNGVVLNDIYPELMDIKDISQDTCVFDGEIVLLDNKKPSFTKVMERFKLKDKQKILIMKKNNPVTFVCFDILYKNKDLTKLSLIERKKILDKFKNTNNFVKIKYVEERGKDLFNVVKKGSLEGVVAKKKESRYFYGVRTKDWLKIKNWISENFYVCGYDIIKENNVISVILGEKRENNFYYIGKVVMGNKNNLYDKIKKSRKIKNYLKEYDNSKSVFIKPVYRLNINYIERTKDNMLREAFIKR